MQREFELNVAAMRALELALQLALQLALDAQRDTGAAGAPSAASAATGAPATPAGAEAPLTRSEATELIDKRLLQWRRSLCL